MPYWPVLGVSVAYVGVLFVIAWWGDRRAASDSLFPMDSRRAAVAYALTLAVYNTSWSFYASAGRAAAVGYEFLPIYIGQALLLIFGQPLYAKVLTIAKAQNATSISDFIAARYGKSQTVAALVTLMTLFGVLPYIALQLKAVGVSFDVLTARSQMAAQMDVPFWEDTSFAVAAAMAVFTIVFGVRHIHASEHHRGLMLAIAFEGLVKLSAFIAVGLFIVYGMFDGFTDLYARARANPDLHRLTDIDLSHANWYSVAIVSTICFVCLPQAFHVTAVENENPRHMRPAAWLYPGYLAILSVFMVPIAIAGLTTFGDRVNPDTYVINLPISADAGAISLFAFIGGFSAATGMVIVAGVSLSTMICNDVVMPVLLNSRRLDGGRDISRVLLLVRRTAVLVILLLAYVMYRTVDQSYPLTEIGLMSFVAVAQFGPAFFGGLYWRRANRAGALAGMIAGFAIWAYTLLAPSLVKFAPALAEILADGPGGIGWLRPQALFGVTGLDPISHATLWSLLANILAFTIISMRTSQSAVERTQSAAFVHGADADRAVTRPWSAVTTLAGLREVAARFVGPERADAAFDHYLASTGIQPDPSKPAGLEAVRFTENLVAGSIGAASARIVMAAALESRTLSRGAAMAMLDDATEALRFNRKLLQATLENVGQGICVVDTGLRIIAWNARFLELLDLQGDLVRVGLPLKELVAFIASRGEYGADDFNALIINRDLEAQNWPYVYERRRPDGAVLEITYNRMPEGGFVSTFKDVTERHRAAQALREANESLERRVEERTKALAAAKAEAERANAHKSRFLAAASHDLLQPLNAARLFVSALEEKLRPNGSHSTERAREWNLAGNATTSLHSAEMLLDGLLDMSSLDTGVVRPDIQVFPLEPLLSCLNVEFSALARERGLTLHTVTSHCHVRSDQQLLRRVLQNYLSNALRYTPSGRILLGCRRRGGHLRIMVRDTGIGIPADKQQEIFQEFRRLDSRAGGQDRGLGLGLAIVDRISRLLNHEITLSSTPGRGACFAIDVPVAPRPAARLAVSSGWAGKLEQSGRLVLCIDNETSILQGMDAILSQWGYRVLTARDGAEALELLGGAVPDAVLIDYHLDGPQTGIAVLDMLRQRWQRKVEALLVTADRGAGVLQEAQSHSCEVLYKPVKPASLRRFLTAAALRGNGAEPEDASRGVQP